MAEPKERREKDWSLRGKILGRGSHNFLKNRGEKA